LAAKGGIAVDLFLATLAGISLIIASACVINNYTDRGIDKAMERTQGRALASGAMGARNAIIYAAVLGLAGFGLLAIQTNALTVMLGVLAVLTYTVLYAIAKRRSVHGTVVGSVAGALPPVAGYTAVSNSFDLAAAILLLVMVFWQMPHFYAIAMYRLKDYKAAGIPVLPAVATSKTTKRYILVYIIAFILAVSALAFTGYTGYTYLVVMSILGAVWLGRGLQGFEAKDDEAWARRIFFFSLIIITIFSLLLVLNAWLP